nr:MAG TPA: hypothetical protein [Caudoviricetes sp.]
MVTLSCTDTTLKVLTCLLDLYLVGSVKPLG